MVVDDEGPPVTQPSQPSEDVKKKSDKKRQPKKQTKKTKKTKTKKSEIGESSATIPETLEHPADTELNPTADVPTIPEKEDPAKEEIHDSAGHNAEDNAEEFVAGDNAEEFVAGDNAEELDKEFFGDDSSEGAFNSADERMALDSGDESGSDCKEFNELTDMEDPQFEMGMKFTSGRVFRGSCKEVCHKKSESPQIEEKPTR